MIGKTIGHYRIVGQLGRGGMGTVYKAVDETLDREVAIKILNPELADNEIMKRFRAEATILAKLNHPGIATIYELFRAETDLLMVMEFVRGETLDAISDRLGPLPPEQAAYLVDKVLSGLEHAHRAGIVHRDMKPANVMVTEDGGVKIMDFGIARARGAEHVTVDGYMIGTPAYMPPEQVLGQSVDGRSDLYSVGVILYRLLTGALPFTADTAIAVVVQQISAAPTPLHVHREGLPGWCATILQRALAKSPDDRFQTAEEFREALGHAADTITTDLTKAFALHIADTETTIAASPNVPERFAITPAARPSYQTQVLVVPDTVPPTGSATDVGGTPALASAARWVRNADGATIVLRHPRGALSGPTLAIMLGVFAVLAIIALRRPPSAPVTETAPVQRASPVTTPAFVGPTSPVTTAAVPRSSVEPATSSPREREVRLNKPVVAPFGFEARALVGSGERRRERKSQVMLADGKINVQASDDDTLLQAVRYEDVISISYSRGRDPFWNAPAGPTVVARVSGLDLGIFRRDRHWLSLRTRNTKPEFVVLRVANAAQADDAITAFEERTGRKAVLVAERKDDR
jgi:serine/threonine protein kinase